MIVHNCILGLGYGTGKDKLQTTLKTGGTPVIVDISTAQGYVNTYRQTYPMIVRLWKESDRALDAMVRGREYHLGVGTSLLCNGDGVHLPNGMLLRYPGLRRGEDGFEYDTRYGVKKIYGAALVENIIQALARIVVFWQMCRIDQNLRKYDNVQPGMRFKVVLTVHDEVVVCCPSPASKRVLDMMLRIMHTVPKWTDGCPIAAEGNTGANYAECK